MDSGLIFAFSCGSTDVESAALAEVDLDWVDLDATGFEVAGLDWVDLDATDFEVAGLAFLALADLETEDFAGVGI